MEFFYTLMIIPYLIKLKFCLKICFILLIFLALVYLLLDNLQEKKELSYTEASFFNQKIRNILIYGSGIASIFGTGLAFKNEIKDYKKEILDNELEEKRNLLETTFEKLEKVKSELDPAEYKKYGVKILNIRIDNHFNNLQLPQASSKILLNKALELQEIINNPDLSVTDKIKAMRNYDTASFIYNRDLGEFRKLSDSLSINLDNIHNDSALASETTNSDLTVLPVDEINKSSIIDWDWFESLDTWHKLSISLLLLNSVVFSSRLSESVLFLYTLEKIY